MKAVEFESSVNQSGQILLPPEVAGEIPIGEQLEVAVMWENPTVDSAWRLTGRRQFEAAYCPDDDVYDQLIQDESR